MLRIICPTAIPEFVPIIQGWTDSHLTTPFELVFEKGDPPSGQKVRQKYTDLWAGEDAYVYYHDHDSLISTDVCNWLNTHLLSVKPSIIMFGEVWWANGPKRLTSKAENCFPIRCDISQLFVHAKFINGLAWTNDYHNDGLAIKYLFDQHENEFIFVDEINAWYNALKPNTSLFNGQIIHIA